MVRPIVSDTVEEAFEGLTPWNGADESTGWDLLTFLNCALKPLELVDFLVRDRDDRPGWSIIMDVDNAPAEYLPWLGQFVGVVVDAGLSEDVQREQIKLTQGYQRGTKASMIAAAQLYLTGNRSVTLFERDTSAYHLTVRTFDAETPYPDRVLAALLSQKPAGLVMDYAVSDGLTYDEIAASGRTYDELTGFFPTSDQMKNAQVIP